MMHTNVRPPTAGRPPAAPRAQRYTSTQPDVTNERTVTSSISSRQYGFEDIVRYQSLFRNDGLFNYYTIYTQLIQLIYLLVTLFKSQCIYRVLQRTNLLALENLI